MHEFTLITKNPTTYDETSILLARSVLHGVVYLLSIFQIAFASSRSTPRVATFVGSFSCTCVCCAGWAIGERGRRRRRRARKKITEKTSESIRLSRGRWALRIGSRVNVFACNRIERATSVPLASGARCFYFLSFGSDRRRVRVCGKRRVVVVSPEAGSRNRNRKKKKNRKKQHGRTRTVWINWRGCRRHVCFSFLSRVRAQLPRPSLSRFFFFYVFLSSVAIVLPLLATFPLNRVPTALTLSPSTQRPSQRPRLARARTRMFADRFGFARRRRPRL